MNYKKYEVRSPLFMLRDRRLSEQVVAAFIGAAKKHLQPAETRRVVVRLSTNAGR